MIHSVSVCLSLFWILSCYATLFTEVERPKGRRNGKRSLGEESGDRSSSDDDDDDVSRTGMFADLFTYDEYIEITQNKRIRREIRDLSCDQWNRVSAAMNIMKHTSDEEGIKLYGSDYRSYDSLICQHARGAQNTAGDVLHYGPYFLLGHRAFTLAFENSLLAIDSEIDGAPYWNFIIDVAQYGNHLQDSIIFSDGYYGQFSGDSNYDYAVSNGKFKFWRVNDDIDSLPLCGNDFRNAFGQLRMRTNFNNNEYYTRYGNELCNIELDWEASIPIYDECLYNTTGYGDITSFFWCMNSGIHDSAHAAVGGDHNQFDGQEVDADYCTALFTPFALSFGDSGFIVQTGIESCFDCPTPGTCVVGIDDAKCGQCDIIADSDGYCLIGDQQAPFFGNGDWDTQHILGDFLDFTTSPNDPIFFAHHSNVDRYFMEWQLLHYDSKSDYYGYPESGYPSGVNLNDVIADEYPFEKLFEQDDGPYTFKDVFDYTDIVNAPYTYDTIIDLIQRDD